MTPPPTADRPQLAFVLGTGRCGSSLVHEVLAHHPDAGWISNLDDRLAGTPLHLPARHNGAVHRRLPTWATEKGRARFAPSEGWRLLASQVSPAVVEPWRDLTADDATPWLTERLHALFVGRAEAAGRPVLLHKLTGWPRTGLLDTALDDVRYVHVVRDGRAVAASWLQMPWWRGHLGPAGWHFGPLTDDEAAAWDASGRTQPALAGIAWAKLLDAFVAARAVVGEHRWLEVRYEDLVEDPGHHVDAMARHCRLGPDPALDRAVASVRWRPAGRPWERSLRPVDVAAVETVAAAHLERLGYRA